MASNNRREEDHPGFRPGRTRSQLIERSQERYHEAKSNYLRAAMLSANRNRIAAAVADLHTTVFEFYFAIRPFRKDDNIEQEWTGPDRHVFWSEEVVARDESGAPIYERDRVTGEVQVKTTSVGVGLEELQQYAVRLTEDTRTVRGHMGKRQKTETSPRRLPPDTLITIGDKLEELASELGFVPETPRNEPEVEVTQEDLYEIQEKWAGERDALEGVESMDNGEDPPGSENGDSPDDGSGGSPAGALDSTDVSLGGRPPGDNSDVEGGGRE